MGMIDTREASGECKIGKKNVDTWEQKSKSRRLCLYLWFL